MWFYTNCKIEGNCAESSRQKCAKLLHLFSSGLSFYNSFISPYPIASHISISSNLRRTRGRGRLEGRGNRAVHCLKKVENAGFYPLPKIKGGFSFKSLFDFSLDFMFYIQHCFICRSADSTVSEDAGIELRPYPPPPPLRPALVCFVGFVRRRWTPSATITMPSVSTISPQSGTKNLASGLWHWQSNALTTRLDHIHLV